jgi:hypothetical protein
MNLFRSEEHIARWLAGRELGATISVATPRRLRMPGGRPDRAHWRPHTREQNQAILEQLGLTGEFWALP